MKRLILVCVMISMFILSFAFAEAPADRLGFTLLEQMYSDGQNLVFSPVSLSFSLGMAAEGAAGQTGEEIQRLINMHGEEAAGLITGLSAKGIRIANAAFTADELPILESWRITVTGAYAGEIFPLGRQEDIDSWVRQKTDGLLEYAPGNLSEDTKLVLLNAVAMEMDWRLPFFAEATHDAIFHSPASDQTVPFMAQTYDWNTVYGERDGVQMLQLDYAETYTGMAMLIALPPDGKLPDLLFGLREEGLDYFSCMEATNREITLLLPKVDVTTHTDLTEPLQAAGIRIAFTDAADFSGISAVPVKTDRVCQDARLMIDEEGTCAAAVTEIDIPLATEALQLEEPILMNVDRPFVALIVDRETDAIVFAAVIADPVGANAD